jgi:cytochrome P450
MARDDHDRERMRMDVDFTFRPGEGLPLTALEKIRDAGPVFWSEALGAWAVTSYAAVQEVLSDLDRFTSVGTPVEETLGPEGMLLNDTSMHNRMRAVWTRAMSRSAMAARSAELESLARDVLETARRQLDAGETVNLMSVIQQFTLRFVASLFAIPEEQLGAIQQWNQLSTDAPVLELADEGAARARHLAAKQGVYELVRSAVADRHARLQRGEVPEDLVGLMAAAEVRDGITSAMVLDNLFNIIIGSDTTERWIGNAIVRLLTDPGLRAQLRADPGLLEPALQEVMRIDTVAQVIMRRVKAGGAHLGGQTLQGGDQLVLMLGAANSDPAAFENAGAFDIARPAKQNMGFGYGLHNCLGINIARQEAMAFVSALLDVLPDLRLARCDYGETWALWGPRCLEVVSAS